MGIRCFQYKGIEVRVLAHFKNKKIDTCIMASCSPIDKMAEGEAMMELIEAKCIGMTVGQWLGYVPDWSSLNA